MLMLCCQELKRTFKQVCFRKTYKGEQECETLKNKLGKLRVPVSLWVKFFFAPYRVRADLPQQSGNRNPGGRARQAAQDGGTQEVRQRSQSAAPAEERYMPRNSNCITCWKQNVSPSCQQETQHLLWISILLLVLVTYRNKLLVGFGGKRHVPCDCPNHFGEQKEKFIPCLNAPGVFRPFVFKGLVTGAAVHIKLLHFNTFNARILNRGCLSDQVRVEWTRRLREACSTSLTSTGWVTRRWSWCNRSWTASTCSSRWRRSSRRERRSTSCCPKDSSNTKQKPSERSPTADQSRISTSQS